MTCNEAAEFVSALCDGETIPGYAAEHIGGCAACQQTLEAYLEMGEELRHSASLDVLTVPPRPAMSASGKGLFHNWWRASWQAVRIPRLAVISLLLLVAALGSGLVTTRVRARDRGNVVLLKVTVAPGQSNVCPLSARDEKWNLCGGMSAAGPGFTAYQMKLLAVDGDHITLGVRAKFFPMPPGRNELSIESIRQEPERQYSFEPGRTLEVEVPGSGPLTVTGEWIDHMPAIVTNNPNLDPNANELRIVSPMVLSDRKVVGNVEGGSVFLTSNDALSGAWIYLPGQGLFGFSNLPFDGGFEGQVKLNRITFESEGHHYEVVTGAPITRSEHIWVLHDPNFKPEGQRADAATIGSGDLNKLMGK